METIGQNSKPTGEIKKHLLLLPSNGKMVIILSYL